MVKPVCASGDEAGEPVHEPDTLRGWHESHSTWLHAFLRRSLRIEPAEADDLIQDTWLRVIRISLAEVENPRAFLSRIAVNLFRDRQRHEAVRRNHRHLVLASDRDRVDTSAITEQEANHELERVILDLPGPVRDVFLLSRFRGMTNKQIAAHFGISVKTVEWRIGKAIEICTANLRG
ncbi:RNA polymerase sigma factor [Sphingomonas adhaesiva]|uniref:RNA polymerase sigma factor n=1 Tax=Sphingomonas adhaesiva TaxID=28212 RepID=UPI002FF99A47